MHRPFTLRGTALALAAALQLAAGAAFAETRATAGTPQGSFSEDDSSTQPVVGVGARRNFTDSIAARLEWERVRARFLDDEKVDTDVFSLGVQVCF